MAQETLRQFSEDVFVSKADVAEKAVIHIFAKENSSGVKDRQVSYFVNGVEYTVKTGIDVTVPLSVAKTALRSGDIDSYKVVKA